MGAEKLAGTREEGTHFVELLLHHRVSHTGDRTHGCGNPQFSSRYFSILHFLGQLK